MRVGQLDNGGCREGNILVRSRRCTQPLKRSELMITLARASRRMVKRIGIICPLAAALLPMTTSVQRGSAPRATKMAPAARPHTELTDVNTGETFTPLDFTGNPVLLESFAVWCPVCLSQQRHIGSLHNTRNQLRVGQLRHHPPTSPRERYSVTSRRMSSLTMTTRTTPLREWR